MAPQPLPNVVLSGAGISGGEPARLPWPWDLMQALWGALRANEPLLITDTLTSAVFDRIGERDYNVRMEQFLESLSGGDGIPTLVLAEVYKLVASNTPNNSHRRLVSLNAKQFTVNMDTLLEAAGATRVEHLHGTWDNPSTIKTTVEHYAHGLTPVLERRFARAIRGQHLLVVGYSGQDIDVMPIIERHPPAKITWVSPSADDLGLEASALRENRLRHGREFIALPLTADAYLAPLVPMHPATHAARAPLPDVDLVEVLRSRTTHNQRVHALAQLLLTIGMSEEALAVLASECVSPRHAALTARALDRLDRPREALEMLRRNGGLWTHAGAMSSLARKAGDSRAEQQTRGVLAIKRLLPGNRRHRWLRRIQQGKRMAVKGRPAHAVRTIARVTRLGQASRVLSPSNLVDALTWHADALKEIGNLEEARRTIARAEQLSPFADESQRAYALWKRGEIDFLSGGSTLASLDSRFSTALHFAERSSSRDTQAWIRGTVVEMWARYDPKRGRGVATTAEALGAGSDVRSGHGPAYFALQQAILAASTLNLDDARAHQTRAATLARERRVPALALQADLFAVYLRWLTGEAEALRTELLRVQRAARRGGLPLVEARARAAASLVVGKRPPGAFLQRVRSRGWDIEDFTLRMSDDGKRAGFYVLV